MGILTKDELHDGLLKMMGGCAECEKLRRENEELKAKLKNSHDVVECSNIWNESVKAAEERGAQQMAEVWCEDDGTAPEHAMELWREKKGREE